MVIWMLLWIHNEKKTPHGVLQGPVIWAILSSAIFINKNLFELVGKVDDAYLIQSCDDADKIFE